MVGDLYTILTSKPAQRQDDFEAAPHAGLAARRQRATVALDDLAADRQAESGSFRLGGEGIADLSELLENRLDLRWRDANAAVLDLDDGHAIVRAGPHRDVAAGSGELGGVREQVG